MIVATLLGAWMGPEGLYQEPWGSWPSFQGGGDLYVGWGRGQGPWGWSHRSELVLLLPSVCHGVLHLAGSRVEQKVQEQEPSAA